MVFPLFMGPQIRSNFPHEMSFIRIFQGRRHAGVRRKHFSCDTILPPFISFFGIWRIRTSVIDLIRSIMHLFICLYKIIDSNMNNITIDCTNKFLINSLILYIICIYFLYLISFISFWLKLTLKDRFQLFCRNWCFFLRKSWRMKEGMRSRCFLDKFLWPLHFLFLFFRLRLNIFVFYLLSVVVGVC